MRKYILFAALFLLGLGMTSCDEIEDIISPDAPEELDKTKLLRLVNEARQSGCDCGNTYYPPVAPLVWSDKLEEAAQLHSDDMNENDHFSHTGSQGSSVGDRLDAVNYLWSTYGENIAMGYPDEESVIKGWLDSPGHCQNIMGENFTEMAVASSGSYWTQLLARPR